MLTTLSATALSSCNTVKGTALVADEGGDGYACIHGITAKANVVIDVSACSFGVADQGVTPATSMATTIINAIAAKFGSRPLSWPGGLHRPERRPG